MDERDEAFEELIERSSLGTPGARQLRRRTPRSQVDAVRQIVQLRNQMVHSSGPESAAVAGALVEILRELGYHGQADHVLAEAFPAGESVAVVRAAEVIGGTAGTQPAESPVAGLHAIVPRTESTTAAPAATLAAVASAGSPAALWQLILSGSGDNDDACRAFAVQFATLVERGDKAHTVVSLLDRMVERAGQGGFPRPQPAWGMRALLAVLSVRNPRTGHPSVFVYLDRYPERADSVGRLWAHALRHRGYRVAALQALVSGLGDAGSFSSQTDEVARLLGEALTRCMPIGEHQQLFRDLEIVAARAQQVADHDVEAGVARLKMWTALMARSAADSQSDAPP